MVVWCDNPFCLYCSENGVCEKDKIEIVDCECKSYIHYKEECDYDWDEYNWLKTEGEDE